MTKKKRKTEKEKAWESLAEAFAIYLSTVGWSVLVVSSPRIQHKPGAQLNFNYEFVLSFTGKQLSPAQKLKSVKDGEDLGAR